MASREVTKFDRVGGTVVVDGGIIGGTFSGMDGRGDGEGGAWRGEAMGAR